MTVTWQGVLPAITTPSTPDLELGTPGAVAIVGAALDGRPTKVAPVG
jgi:hypothetical protein